MLDGYMAVGNKCAVDFESFHLPISTEDALRRLWDKGFRVVNVDLEAMARSCIGKSLYRRGTGFYEAPNVVDCSTFTKWVYAKAGIWLPRHSIDQKNLGKPVDWIESGDLLFIEGAKPYWDSEDEKIGHVGICTEDQTVIHAANSERGVVEDPISCFEKIRAIRRIKPKSVITLESPTNRPIEWSGEIKRILCQRLE